MSTLLEREVELAAIGRQLDEASNDEGSLVVVEGPAGIGKTTLLREAVAMAHSLDMAVLQAKGGILEQRLAPLRSTDSRQISSSGSPNSR